ncbi:MAG: 50S ribosomal protein L5, partial [Candidatus Pacebacteria bacterium]|nr:50S ribosomal protein L5 [Candidatus Paceibacterota bacterium]
MKSIKEKQDSFFKEAKDKFGYKNVMSSPKILKVAVSVATGTMMKKDNKRNDFVSDRLAKITGQKPAVRGAKKSVASFKVRQGDPIGLLVILRGNRMQDFLEKLINIALPRTKDFRGINPNSVDNIGNITFGIKEHTIFPETSDEDIKDIFGMAITIETSAKSKEEAKEFLT